MFTSGTTRHALRALALALGTAAVATSCAWNGVETLPLPGAPGQGGDAITIEVEMANIGTLVQNSPVMVDDVVVGSVSGIRLDGWHAVVQASIRPDAAVPADVVATVGQTSLLGSSHLALNTPAGRPPAGTLASGVRIPLNASSTYPSTEQTLASLSVVVNGGGLGQLGDIIHSLNDAFDGRQQEVGALLDRLNTVMGTLDGQRADILASIDALNRLGGRFAEQRDTVSRALTELPPALDVLLAERPAITDALNRLRTFSDTSTAVVRDVQADLVTNLRNLEPTLAALADVGPQLDAALAYATVYPYGQKTIDGAARGDYLNLFATVDLTIPRLRRELLLGTPYGDPTSVVQAAIGDPGHAQQTSDPLRAGIAPNGGR